jgi:Rrf2 family protein
MQRLTRAGLVVAGRGPKGGFTLSQKTKKVKLKDIFELMDGKPDLSDCLLKTKICKRPKCLLGLLLSDTNKKFEKVMNTDIKELII